MFAKQLTSAALALALFAGMPAQAAQSLPQPRTAYVDSVRLSGGVSVSSLKFGKIPVQICTGKQIKPDITVKDGAKKLVLGRDYTVTYKNNKSVGTASAVVKGMGGYAGSKTLTFKIRPAAPELEITRTDKTLALSWNRVRGASGYQIYYSINGGDYKRLASTGKTSCAIIKPDPRAGVYRFKVRAYKKVGGKTLCGSFSEPMVPGRPSENALADDGGVLTIVVNGSADLLVDSFAADMGHSGKVNVISIDYPFDVDSYRSVIDSAEDIDLIIMGADYVQQLINIEGVTVPLSQIGLDRSDFSDALGYTFACGTAQDGSLMAACCIPSPGAFVYRTDLAEKYLGVTSPEEMQQLVKDWDAFAQTGERLNRASGGQTALAASLYGGMFRAYVSGLGGSWVNGGTLDMEKVEGLLDFAERMQASGAADRIMAWSDEWFNAITNERALGEFLPSWGLLDFEYSMLCQFSNEGKYGMAVCEGPAGWYWGGTYIAVSSRCDNASLAKEFIEYLCINEQSMSRVSRIEGDFMNSTSVMGALDRSNSLLGGQNEYPVLIRSAKRLGEGGASVYDEGINEAALNAVMMLVQDGFTRESVLEVFKNDVRARFPELDFG